MRRYITRTLALALAFTLALALLPAGALALLGDTFSAANSDGVTIHYEVTGEVTGNAPGTVQVIADPNGNKYEGDIVIPATATNAGKTYKVTAIGTRAFDGCLDLDNVVIPEGVTAIGDSAFFGCNQPFTVAIPESVTIIGKSAFQGCNNLKLSGAVLPTGLQTLGPYAFTANTLLTSITIPGGVRVVGDSAFEACHALQSVTLEHGVETIDHRAFMNCYALTDVKIPNTVTSIGDGAFANCRALTSIILPDNLTTLGKQAFAIANDTSKLSDVTLPDSLTSIGPDAFLNCPQLMGVTLRVGGNTTVYGKGYARDGGTRVDIPNEKPITKAVLLPGGRVTNNTGGTLTVVMNGREYALADGQTMAYSAPAAASYGPTLYSLRVEGGTGTGSYPAGQAVTIRANDGAPFTQWVLASGVGTIGDPFSRETTFTMGNGGAVVTALNAAPPKTGDGPALWLGLALVVLAGGLLAYRKKNNRA